MAVRVGEKAAQESISNPGVCTAGQCDKSDEPGEDPDVRETGHNGSFLELGRDPRKNKKLYGVEELRWDSEQIGLENREPEFAEDV